MGQFTQSLLIFAQQQTVSVPKPGVEEAPLLSPWMMGLIVVVVLGVPFLLGAGIARALKMKELSTKIGVILLALVLGLSPFAKQYVIGALEKRRHEEKVAKYEEKEKYRKQISAGGMSGLKKANSGLQIQWRQETSTSK